MKFALVLLVLLPLTFAEPEKRFLLQDLTQWLNLGEIKHTVQTIVDKLGSDPTEHKCETECQKIIHATIIPKTCPSICKEFQVIVKHLNIAPKTL